MPKPAWKHKSSDCRPLTNLNIDWDGLQFLCVSLCRSLLKTTSCPIADHAEILILAEMVFNFYHELMLSGWSCADAPLAGCMDWMTVWCQAALLTRFTKKCAPCAHSPRTHCALKIWCDVALGTHGAPFHPCDHLQRFYCILHILKGCRVTKLIPWERPHSTYLLWFICFQRMPINKSYSMGASTFNVSIAFYMFWKHVEQQNWFHRSVQLQISTW